jgi:hypothetical protein
MEPISAVSYRRAQCFPRRPWQRPSVREPCRRSGTSQVRSAQSGDAWDRCILPCPRPLRPPPPATSGVHPHTDSARSETSKGSLYCRSNIAAPQNFLFVGRNQIDVHSADRISYSARWIACRSVVLLVVVLFIARLVPSFQSGPKLRRWAAAAALSHACHAAMIAPLKPPLRIPPTVTPRDPVQMVSLDLRDRAEQK